MPDFLATESESDPEAAPQQASAPVATPEKASEESWKIADKLGDKIMDDFMAAKPRPMIEDLLDRFVEVYGEVPLRGSMIEPGLRLWRDYYEWTGDHMFLTDEGWEPGEVKQSYLDHLEPGEPASSVILDEVNASDAEPQQASAEPDENLFALGITPSFTCGNGVSHTSSEVPINKCWFCELAALKQSLEAEKILSESAEQDRMARISAEEKLRRTKQCLVDCVQLLGKYGPEHGMPEDIEVALAAAAKLTEA
jgi:hypothetical protein